MGEEGLKLLGIIRKELGIPVVTEVMDIRKVEIVAGYADMIQIGSRNMQNYPSFAGSWHVPETCFAQARYDGNY